MLLCSLILLCVPSIKQWMEFTQATQLVTKHANEFIFDAHLAREFAIQRKYKVSLYPLCGNDWLSGWQIRVNPDFDFLDTSDQNPPLLVRRLDNSIQHRLLLSGAQFADMSLQSNQENCSNHLRTSQTRQSTKKHITFNEGGFAQMHRGGMFANRLILTHSSFPSISRHIILGAGGRLRVCNPLNFQNKC